jgi:hypothetical protein
MICSSAVAARNLAHLVVSAGMRRKERAWARNVTAVERQG